VDKYKKFIKFSIAIFSAAGVILLLGPRTWFPGFYNPRFMGSLAFISIFIILLLAIILKADSKKKQKALLEFQSAVTSTLLLSGAGGLGLYRLYLIGFQYDKVIHFLIAYITTIALIDFIQKWYDVNLKKSIILTCVIVALLGLFWEITEFLTDVMFGVHTFGIYGKYVVWDTFMDIMMNFLGLFLGVISVGGQKKIKDKLISS